MSYYSFILKKIDEITQKISSHESNNFIEFVLKSPRLYIIGAGRSGLWQGHLG